jgi:hypothetical protein
MRDSSTLFCSSKLPWPPDRISLKFIDILGTRAEKLWAVLLYSVVVVTCILYIKARNMRFSQIMCLWVSYDDQNKQYNSDQKIEVFWDVTPCQLKSSYQCFGAESFSAAPVTVYQLTRLHFPGTSIGIFINITVRTPHLTSLTIYSL